MGPKPELDEGRLVYYSGLVEKLKMGLIIHIIGPVSNNVSIPFSFTIFSFTILFTSRRSCVGVTII